MDNPPPRRQLGLFDATMIVMGGIVGSGIFRNPSVVAHSVHTPFLILGVWVLGGALAMAGAFIWAELATRLPGVGGQYAYLREAYHPAVAFLYGWVLLLVTQTAGMAAVAITFAGYFREISGLTWSDSAIGAVALLALTAINCLGAKAGSNVQSALMLMKTGAIAALVIAGLALGGGAIHPLPLVDRPVSFGLLRAVGAAMIPVAFAYGGWQTASFVAGEMRDPRRDLSRGLLLGVAGVVALYLAVNVACLKVLGPAGLDRTATPASDVMRAALGDKGALFIAVGIAVSTLGFLSQGMLTAPRVYNAMARDGLFFERVGRLSPRTGAPVVAIVLQGVLATAIACSGRYEQILNYEVSVDFLAFTLAALALYRFRRQNRGGAPSGVPGASSGVPSGIPSGAPSGVPSGASSGPPSGVPSNVPSAPGAIFLTPGYPYTPALFALVCLGVVASTILADPFNSVMAILIMLAGLPVYWYWRRRRVRPS